MPAVWTVSQRRDAQLNLHPEILAVPGVAPQRSGAFRAVRCRIVASGTYAAGGTVLPDVGIKDIQGVLLVGDIIPAGTWSGVPRFNTATRALQLYSLAGVEQGATAATGQFELLIFGFSG